MEELKAKILKGTIIKEVSSEKKFILVSSEAQTMNFKELTKVDDKLTISEECLTLTAIDTELYIIEKPTVKMEIFNAYGTLDKKFDVLFGIYDYDKPENDPMIYGRQLSVNPFNDEVYGFIASPKLVPNISVFLAHNEISADNYVQEELVLYPETISTNFVTELVGDKFNKVFKIIRKENKKGRTPQSSLLEFLTIHGFDRLVKPLVDGYDNISENNTLSEEK